MDDLPDLIAQRYDLEAHLKEIATKKETVLLQNAEIKEGLDLQLFDARQGKNAGLALVRDSLNSLGVYRSDLAKLQIQGPKQATRLAKDITITLDDMTDKDLADRYDEDSFIGAFNHILCEAIVLQYKHYVKTGKIGNFIKDAKKFITDTLKRQDGAKLTDVDTGPFYEYLDDFNQLLEQFKANEEDLEKLAAESKSCAQKKQKLEQRIANTKLEIQKYQIFLKEYTDIEQYKLAFSRAQALKTALDKNRREKLAKIKPEFDSLIDEFTALQQKVLPFSSQAYSILQQYAKTDDSDCTALLSAKKKLLAACKNCNPEKELGLFRTKVLVPYGCGYINKKHISIVLSTFRQIDDVMIMRLQNLHELDAKIHKLNTNYKALQGIYS